MALMPYRQALVTLCSEVNGSRKSENVNLAGLKGRILAEDIKARFDSPRFDNSAMDGYAVCGTDRLEWKLIDAVSAGDSTQYLTLREGEAVRILTGAALPAGAEAVIIQEDVYLDSENTVVRCVERVRAGKNIRFQGEEYQQNEILLEAKNRMNSAAVGVVAGQGLAGARCFNRLRVSVFSSGDEIMLPGEALQENKIFDSNRPMLLAALSQTGVEPHDGGLLPDNLQQIKASLQSAAETSDVLLISGGASVGDKDYTKEALSELGELWHWKLLIKPGKPFGWGKIGNCYVFILPGNPVAGWVTYQILVQPALYKLMGLSAGEILPKFVQAAADFEINTTQSREQFLRGTVVANGGQLQARIDPQQGSAMLGACAYSNALVVIPPNTVVEHGMLLDILYTNT